MTLLRAAWTLTLLLTIAVSLFAQNKLNLQGSIKDEDGAAIAGARVKLSRVGVRFERDAVSDANGDFRFPALYEGNYQVTIEAQGFSSASRDVALGSSKPQELNFTLSVAGISEKVTVTATRTELATTDTAVPVSIVTRKELEQKTLNSIGDAFRDLPGTSTVNEGAFQVRPRIRGLDSNRVLILIDGERLNNARTSTDNSGVEIGLVEIDQIETLEVVRGAGSVLYGTDALAGTINIITKDAPRNPNNGFRFGGSFNGYFSSNETGRRGSLAVMGSSRFFAFRIAQSLERYNNYHSGNADFLTDTEVGNSQSHGGNTQLTTRFFFDDDNDLRLNFERRRAANIGVPGLTLEGGFNAFFPFSDRDKFNARFETRNISNYLARISASFYTQRQKRNFSNILFIPPAPPFFPGINNFSETITDTTSVGFDVQSNWLLGSRNFLTAGISFFHDDNKDARLQETRIPVATQNRSTSVPNADFGSFAGFAQDEFDVTNRLKLIGGVRVERFFSSSRQTGGFALPATFTPDQLEDLGIAGLDTGLSVKETSVTGDLGAVFKVAENVSLTGRIGRSYRVPNLFERFFTGAGSVGGFVVGNPNLKPETGINFDTGIKVRTAKFAGSFTYFNNHYRDFLSTVQAFDRDDNPITIPGPPDRPPTLVSQTVNIGRARIQGFEAELEVPFRIGNGFLIPNGNISYLHGDDLEVNQPLNTITPLKTVLNLRWQDLESNYFGEFQTRIVNRQDRLSSSFLAANGGPEPGFAVSEIRGGYTFRRERYRLSFNAGITNLFDRLYSEQFVSAPARGRSFVFGTTLELY
jgi:hemoglobin/transferrin/lactoferrin receptor protein